MRLFILTKQQIRGILKKVISQKTWRMLTYIQGKPNKEKIGTIKMSKLQEIAKVKMPDLNAADLDAAMRTVAGSARSMGIIVEGM